MSFGGRLSGSSSGNCSEASSKVAAGSWEGKRPSSAVSKFRCTVNCFCNGGNVAWACAKVASTAATSASATWPSWSCLRKMPSDLVSILMISSVAAIYPRRDASCTAAATTLEVTVRYAASS